MVRHYDPNDVKKDEFQVQFYGIKPVSGLPEFPNALHDPFGTRGGDDILLRYGYKKGLSVEFGTPEAFNSGVEPKTGGLGIGFGDAVSRTAQTRGTNIDYLRGAFKIIVTPQ